MRKDGWYWIKKLEWGDAYSGWVPAQWRSESHTWNSAEFSGITDQEVIVGDQLVAPAE